jgi:TetR/AcrR family transcriptional regulator, cholesterol catabolism regulator
MTNGPSGARMTTKAVPVKSAVPAKGRPAAGSDRRAELLTLAAGLFADRGYKNTTVRDIADAAGILSGSLYHHFDSKETMADEILSTFLTELFGRYREIAEHESDPRKAFEALVEESFRAIDRHHAAIAIYQNEGKQLGQLPRFAYLRDSNREFKDIWLGTLEKGIETGAFRADLDATLAYRFVRDTVWVAVRWYQPGGKLTAEAISAQYLAMILEGFETRRSS